MSDFIELQEVEFRMATDIPGKRMRNVGWVRVNKAQVCSVEAHSHGLTYSVIEMSNGRKVIVDAKPQAITGEMPSDTPPPPLVKPPIKSKKKSAAKAPAKPKKGLW